MRRQDIIASSKRSAPAVPSAISVTNVGTNRAYNDGRADVTITPGFDGKLPITSYSAVSSPGSFSGTNSTNVIQITGLQSATSYTFSGTVSNAIGPSPALTSLPITITTVPQTPTIGTASRVSNTVARVLWTPGNNGGATLSQITVESNPSISLSYTTTDVDGSIDVTGAFVLSGSYSFRIRVNNVNGPSLFTAYSNAIIVNQPVSPNFPTPNFPTPNFPTPNFPVPDFPVPSFISPNFPTPNFPTPNFPTPNFPGDVCGINCLGGIYGSCSGGCFE